MWLAHLVSPRNMLRILGAVLLVGGGSVIYLGMGSPLVWVVMVLGFVTVVASFFADSALASRRRHEAQAFAQLHGWVYHEQLSGLLTMLRTPPFTGTDTRYVDVIRGTFRGHECYDGTYEWRMRIDEDIALTGRHRVAVVRLADELSRLMLIPEGITSAISKFLGGRDRDFELSSFNRNWRVICEDPRIAHDMLGPRVLARLDGMLPRAPLLFERGLAVRIDDEAEGISSLANRLDGLIAVAKFLPRHTVDDHGRLANSPGPLPSVLTPGAFTGGYRPDLAEADDAHRRRATKRKFDARFARPDPSRPEDDDHLAPGPPAQ